MRIAIFGLGAVGGNIAAQLAHAGFDVSAIARGETLKALRDKGLTLHTGERSLHVRIPATDNAADIGPQDVVISTVKATDPTGQATGIAPLLGPDTAVVFAQNGIPWWYPHGLSASRSPAPDLGFLDPDGALARIVGPGRAIGAAINSPNEMVEPGVIEHDNPARNQLLVGEIDDRQTPRIQALRAALEKAGIGSPEITDIRQALWRKLMINISISMLSLLTGHKATIIRDDARIGELFERIASEGIATATAHGIDVSSFDPPSVRRSPANHLPSVRQDYNRGRALELDALIRGPQAFARAAGIDTPCMDAIVALTARLGADAGLYERVA